jgi:hypothetical protein
MLDGLELISYSFWGYIVGLIIILAMLVVPLWISMIRQKNTKIF